MKFLRAFGLGLIYILLLPVFAVIIAIMAVYGFVEYFVLLVKAAIRFFQGRKGFKPLPEDEQVDAIKAEQLRRQMEGETPSPAPQPNVTPVYIQTNFYPGMQHASNQQQPSSPAASQQPQPYAQPPYSPYGAQTEPLPQPAPTNPQLIDVPSNEPLISQQPAYNPQQITDKKLDDAGLNAFSLDSKDNNNGQQGEQQ